MNGDFPGQVPKVVQRAFHPSSSAAPCLHHISELTCPSLASQSFTACRLHLLRCILLSLSCVQGLTLHCLARPRLTTNLTKHKRNTGLQDQRQAWSWYVELRLLIIVSVARQVPLQATSLKSVEFKLVPTVKGKSGRPGWHKRQALATKIRACFRNNIKLKWLGDAWCTLIPELQAEQRSQSTTSLHGLAFPGRLATNSQPDHVQTQPGLSAG